MEQNNTYAFGPFCLDTGTQLLCNEKSCVNLTPKVYRLLLYFLLHSGRLISHEELFDTVWDGRIVDDSALRLTVNSLRNVLHDESKSPHYILTVCKRGYRFLADVTVKERYRIAEASEKPASCFIARKLRYSLSDMNILGNWQSCRRLFSKHRTENGAWFLCTANRA